MPGNLTRQELQQEIMAALQESDARRELDSLERVVVATRLSDRGIAPPPAPADYPRTVERWMAWVEQSSNGS